MTFNCFSSPRGKWVPAMAEINQFRELRLFNEFNYWPNTPTTSVKIYIFIHQILTWLYV